MLLWARPSAVPPITVAAIDSGSNGSCFLYMAVRGTHAHKALSPARVTAYGQLVPFTKSKQSELNGVWT